MTEARLPHIWRVFGASTIVAGDQVDPIFRNPAIGGLIRNPKLISGKRTQKPVLSDTEAHEESGQVVVNDDMLGSIVAPALGNLTEDMLQRMDEDLKVMMGVIMGAIEEQSDRSWPVVLSTMTKNEVLIADEPAVSRTEKLNVESVNEFDLSNGPDSPILTKVHDWFNCLIDDPEISAAIQVSQDDFTTIVSMAGKAIIRLSLQEILSTVDRQKDLVDIATCLFPNGEERQYFKLARFKLSGWVGPNVDPEVKTCGLSGVYNCTTFHPNLSVIQAMPQEDRERALAIAKSLFHE